MMLYRLVRLIESHPKHSLPAFSIKSGIPS